MHMPTYTDSYASVFIHLLFQKAKDKFLLSHHVSLIYTITHTHTLSPRPYTDMSCLIASLTLSGWQLPDMSMLFSEICTPPPPLLPSGMEKTKIRVKTADDVKVCLIQLII